MAYSCKLPVTEKTELYPSMATQQTAQKTITSLSNSTMEIEAQWNQSKKRFITLWMELQSNNSEASHAKSIWKLLSEKYSEPARFYHTKEHILDCLKQLDSAKDQIPDYRSVELAIWFHDVIYDPAATDNEEQSVILFNKLAQNILPEPVIQKVSKIIKATLHIDNPEGLDEAFMLDIDLSSIADNWQRFTKDNSNLRREVKHLDCKEYCDRKISFFNMLLGKERIFFTDFFHAACEDKARHNMESFIRLQFLTGKCTC